MSRVAEPPTTALKALTMPPLIVLPAIEGRSLAVESIRVTICEAVAVGKAEATSAATPET